MRAIDFYSGVGGWSLGLRFAGIEVTDSFERWTPANSTNLENNRHRVHAVDIRRLDMAALPSAVDIVVGSPPCTQFSLSNRGGSGDFQDGLEDIRAFLRVVDQLRPKCWVMENVPRALGIILREFEPDGSLSDFSHLEVSGRVFKMEEFGLPQRRHRCLIGCLDFGLLQSYAGLLPAKSLGDVLSAYSSDQVVDPIYGHPVTRGGLFDHDPDDFLNSEEQRINRSLKVHHPVYNRMAFPDREERPVRTLTATCTRVSRESIVVADPLGIRRLTVRERASLQGFPSAFQFYGSSHGQKLKMIGNALPPLFAYFVGCAARGLPAAEVLPLTEASADWQPPARKPVRTITDRPAFKFRPDRPFRFAIPSLHLKSGVRFELTNRADTDSKWQVEFKFGSSKSIQSIKLDADLLEMLGCNLGPVQHRKVDSHIALLRAFVQSIDCDSMQRVWSHRGPGTTHPFLLLDKLSELGEALKDDLDTCDQHMALQRTLEGRIGAEWDQVPGRGKLLRNSATVIAGMAIGAALNVELWQRSATTPELPARTGLIAARIG